MKKLINSILALALALVCCFSVACGGSDLDVNSNDFYANLNEQLADVKELTFDVSINISSSSNYYTYSNVANVKGGMSITANNLYYAMEMQGTNKLTEKSDGTSEIDKQEMYMYLYQDKVYMKEGYGEGNEPIDYEYDVMDLAMADMPTWSSGVVGTVDEIMPVVTEFVDAIRSSLEDDFADFSKKAIEMFFTTTETDGGYTIALDSAKIKAVYKDIKDLTIKAFIDKYFGENSFNDLKDSVLELLDKTVNELKAEIDELSNDKFDELIDAIMEIVMSADAANAQPNPIDEILAEYGDKTVAQIISMYTDMTVDEIKSAVGGVFGTLETSKLFSLVGIDNEDLIMISGYVEEYADKIDLAINLDEDGKLVNMIISADLAIDDETYEIDAKIEFGKSFANLASKTSDIKTKYDEEAALSATPIGVYKFQSLTFNGSTYEVGDEINGIEITEDSMVIELKENGICIMKADGEIMEECTWTVNANDNTKVELSESGTVYMTLTVDAGTLIWEESGMIYVFEK